MVRECKRWMGVVREGCEGEMGKRCKRIRSKCFVNDKTNVLGYISRSEYLENFDRLKVVENKCTYVCITCVCISP